MYKYLSHNEIDLQKWDSCIENSSNKNIYALSWFLNIVSENWDGIIEENSEKYLKVFPVTKSRRYGIKYITQPPFAIQLGLFSSTDIVSTNDFVEILKILYLKYSYVLNYPFNHYNTPYIERISDSYSFKQNVTQHISLKRSYEETFSNFSKSRRKNIRKGLNDCIYVEEGNNIDELIDLFVANTAYKIYGGVNKIDYRLLTELCKKGKDKGVVKIFNAKNCKNEIIASTLILDYKTTVVNLFSANNQEGRLRNGESILIDFLIKKYSLKKDFIDLEGTGTLGIKEFKSRFNPEVVTYYSLTNNNLPFLLKIIKNVRKEIFQKLNFRE
ncbi:MAG TPA: hypothetical protein VD908_13125 [Cytophagales bacterium]|nr:hypothetical protein [Cytophagales bacterium]